MTRSLRTAVAVVAALLALGVAATAGAQDPTPTDPTTTTTSTIPGDTTTSTAPLEGPAPDPSIPPSDVTVPPQDHNPTEPLEGVAVPLDLGAAKATLSSAENTLAEALTRRLSLEAQVTALNQQIAAMAQAEQQAIVDLAAAQAQIRRRAVRAYVHGGEDPVKLIGEQYGDPLEYEQRLSIMQSVLEADQRAIVRYREAKEKATVGQVAAAQQIADLAAALEQARLDEMKSSINVVDAQFVLGVAQVGGTLAIHGFVFPVAPPYRFRNDWGEPRNADDPTLAHPHRGTDIAADHGQPLLACERGVIMQMSEGGLGGTGIFLKGASGTVYYYAHLSAYAEGMQVGKPVEPNEVIGYVGQTGSAFGPHLHFQIHPNGGPPINPYPILVAADPTNSHPPI